MPVCTGLLSGLLSDAKGTVCNCKPLVHTQPKPICPTYCSQEALKFAPVRRRLHACGSLCKKRPNKPPAQEQGLTQMEVEALAHQVHDVRNVGAAIASGSFQCSGMVIAPCSMRTLAAVAHGLADNLLTRAADVMLKERRKLVLMVRESPLHLGHLRNMVGVTEMGAIVCPPMPAFYLRPQTVADVVEASVARVLDLLDVPHTLATRWDGQGAP